MKLKKRQDASKSAKPLESPLFVALRQKLAIWRDAKETAREAQNAANRGETAVKNALIPVLRELNANDNDAVIIDGLAVAYRQNESKMISPRVWYDLWRSGKISENQFFGALEVSNKEAENAIGLDQLPDIQTTTLTKTSAIRIAELAPEDAEVSGNGMILPYASSAPTPEQVKKKPTSTAAPVTKKVITRPAQKVAR